MSDQDKSKPPERNVVKREAIQPAEQVSLDESRENTARQLGLTRAHADAYYKRGLQSWDKGDHENAILDLNEAIYYDRGHADYYSTRALFHLEDSQENDAEVDAQYAIKLSKRQWLAYYVLGLMDFRHGDYDSALKHFDDAHKYAGRRAEVLFYRAVTYYFMGNHDKALLDIERAEAAFPHGDKRIKEAQTWQKEIKRSMPAQAKSVTQELKSGSAPPLNKPPERPQIPASTESSEDK